MDKSITISELKNILNEEKINLIDVRSTMEFKAGHIENSINIPLNQIPFECEKFNENESYYIVCLSGARSSRACKFLCKSKNLDAINIDGGLCLWDGALVY